jgi:hypothetical protein
VNIDLVGVTCALTVAGIASDGGLGSHLLQACTKAFDTLSLRFLIRTGFLMVHWLQFVRTGTKCICWCT